MKATELRIGNWYNEFSIPKQATVDLISKLEHIELNGKIAIDVTPIPLTEEWLERFGFERDEEYDEGGLVDYRLTLMKNSLEFVSFWNSEELNGINQPQTRVDVEYVHQLQNLYFALTGKEL